MKPLSFEQGQIVQAKTRFLELFEELLKKGGTGEKGKVRGWLLEAYNKAPELAEIYRVLGEVGSPRTIQDWAQRLRERGPAGLEDRRGRPSGRGVIDADMRLFLEACLLTRPDLTSGQLRKILAMKFKNKQLPKERAIRYARERIWENGL